MFNLLYLPVQFLLAVSVPGNEEDEFKIIKGMTIYNHFSNLMNFVMMFLMSLHEDDKVHQGV